MALFPPSALRELERLSLVVQRARAGMLKGERRSTKRGTSIEFADYRDYTRGDDLRRIDWNVYARLERPFIKLLEEEEDLAVHILVDASASMDHGDGDQHKFLYTQRLAAALGYIALAAGDRLWVAALRADVVSAEFGPARGRAQALGLLTFAEALTPTGETDLDGALHDYGLRARRPGLAFVISDLLAPGGFTAGLSELQGRGYDTVVLHVLHPDEIEPAFSGDLKLVDIETGGFQEVTIDGTMRALYAERLRDWQAELGTLCAKRGALYQPITTDLPWDRLVQYQLRRRGVLK